MIFRRKATSKDCFVRPSVKKCVVSGFSKAVFDDSQDNYDFYSEKEGETYDKKRNNLFTEMPIPTYRYIAFIDMEIRQGGGEELKKFTFYHIY